MADKINPIEMQKYLKDARYPMSRDNLQELASKNDAPKEVSEFLERIPDRTYDGPNAVIHELKKNDDLGSNSIE